MAKTIYPRYVNAFIIIPLTAILLSLLTMVYLKMTKNCVRVNKSPSDLDQHTRLCRETPELYVAALLTIFEGFGGIAYLYSSFFPFLVALDDVINPKFLLNKVLYGVSIGLVYFLTCIRISFPAISGFFVALYRTIMNIYLMLLLPFIWRYIVLVEKSRNLFLVRMEHTWVCCEKELSIRNLKIFSVLESGIVAIVLLSTLCAWLLQVLRIDFYPLVCFPLMLVILGFYLERKEHFYHDFAYAWFLVVLPMTEINILFAAFDYMFAFWTNRNWEMQYLVLCLTEIYIIVMSRIVHKASSYVSEDRLVITALTFPSSFIHMIFQYFILFSVDKFLGVNFWVCLAIVFISNTVKMNLLVYDMYSDLWNKLLSIVRGNPHTETEEHAMADIESHYPTTSGDTNEDHTDILDNTVTELDILTRCLHMLQMKSYVMFLVPIMVAIWFVFDYFVDINVQDQILGCTFSCKFQEQVKVSIYIVYRYLAILGCYFLSLLISVVAFKLSVNVIVKRYPRIQEIMENGKLVDDAIARLRENLPNKPSPAEAQKHRLEREYLTSQVELKRILTVTSILTRLNFRDASHSSGEKEGLSSL